MAATAVAVAPAALRFSFHDELMRPGTCRSRPRCRTASTRRGTSPSRTSRSATTTASICSRRRSPALLHLPVDRGVDVATLLLWARRGACSGRSASAWSAASAPGSRRSSRSSPAASRSAARSPGRRSSPGARRVPGRRHVLGERARLLVLLPAPLVAGHPGRAHRDPALHRARPAEPPGAARRAGGGARRALDERDRPLRHAPALAGGRRGLVRGPARAPARRRMLGVAALAFVRGPAARRLLPRCPACGRIDFVLHAGFTEAPGPRSVGPEDLRGAANPRARGLRDARRARLLFGLLAAGSLVVVNAVRYVGTADIIKFATVAAIALGILASAAVARLLPPPPASRPPPAPARIAAAAVLAAAASAWGCFFVLVFVLDLGDIPASMRAGPAPLEPADVSAVTFLRSRVRRGEVVFRNQRASLGYAHWGGLPQPWVSWMDWSFGIAPDRIRAREDAAPITPPGRRGVSRPGPALVRHRSPRRRAQPRRRRLDQGRGPRGWRRPSGHSGWWSSTLAEPARWGRPPTPGRGALAPAGFVAGEVAPFLVEVARRLPTRVAEAGPATFGEPLRRSFP